MLLASPGDASMSFPVSKSIAAPKQVISFAKIMKIINMKIFKKAEKSYPQGLKFMEKPKNHDYGKIIKNLISLGGILGVGL